MTALLPTRITIEVHPTTSAHDGATTAPTVRVIPEESGQVRAFSAVPGEPREDVPAPAAYDPGPCHCLDDEDCGADHAND